MLPCKDIMHPIGMEGAEGKGLSNAAPEPGIHNGNALWKRARNLCGDEAVKHKHRQPKQKQQAKKHPVECLAKEKEQLEYIGPLHG